MCYKVSWVITNSIANENPFTDFCQFFSYIEILRNLRRFVQRKFYSAEREKNLQSKPRERSFTMTKKWRLKLKFVVDRWRMKKINQQSLLACFWYCPKCILSGILRHEGERWRGTESAAGIWYYLGTRIKLRVPMY